MNEPVAKRTVGEQWPSACEVLNQNGRSPVILLCEHASRHIPQEYAGLGLDDTELSRHIAWDIGAAEVTRSLAQLIDATAFLATYSRLLIDLNRPLGVAGSIPLRSELTDIPGNASLSTAERDRRASRIFTPYHDLIAACVHERERQKRPVVLVAIHSFTPTFKGEQRPWHAGVLFEKAAPLAEKLISGLRTDPALNVGANVPYTVARDEDYALLVHGDDRGNPAVLLEIRNDLIAERAGAQSWAQRLAPLLRQIEG